MKNLKKLTSLLMAMIMVFAMTMTAYADETYAITINNDREGHQYVAYQILSGDLAELDGETILSNIKWADGQSDNAVGDDATEAFEKAEDVIALVEGLTLNAEAGKAAAFADGKYVISGLEAGYYVVRDEKAGSDLGEEDAYSSTIIEVVGNVDVTPKSAAPTVDKEVLDETADAEAGAEEGWGESADHSINESFQFKLIGTIPADEDFEAYDHYKVIFHDTMSKGITFESIASVKVNGNDVTDYVVEGVNAGDKGEVTWKLTIADVLAYDTDLTDGAEIEVIYNAHLNTEAVIGNFDDNNNTVTLTYSNNPNISAEEEVEDEMGKTKEDTVWVFTYETLNTKVDADTKEALAGAEFNLLNAEGVAIKFLQDENGVYYPDETGIETLVSAEETGKFDIKGLDAGDYTLTETKAPVGYNKCLDVPVKITATHAESGDESTATTEIKYNDTDNNQITVENEKGFTLPSTGGMGTTIFYTLGAILLIGSAVVLITKKRMNK